MCGDLVLACLVVNWPRGVIWGSTIGKAECKTTQNKVLKHKVKKGGYSRGGYHTGGVAVATPKCGCSPVVGLVENALSDLLSLEVLVRVNGWIEFCCGGRLASMNVSVYSECF